MSVTIIRKMRYPFNNHPFKVQIMGSSKQSYKWKEKIKTTQNEIFQVYGLT